MVARYRDGPSRRRRTPGRGRRDARPAPAPTSADRLDAFDLTGALERIWEVVRGLNRHVEATAPWQLAKGRRPRGRASTACSTTSWTGSGPWPVALAAYLPETPERILVALGQPVVLDWDEVAYGRARPASGVEPAPPLFPRVDEPTLAA
jgi:methionyl-tRNA synthetase